MLMTDSAEKQQKMINARVKILKTSYFAPASSKEFLETQETIECGFTLKRVRDMTRTYR